MTIPAITRAVECSEILSVEEEKKNVVIDEVTTVVTKKLNEISEEEKKNIVISEVTTVVTKKLNEISDETSQDPKHRAITPLVPTDDSIAWTQVKIGWLERAGLEIFLKPALTQCVKPKVSEEGWKIIDALDPSKVKTFGELERIILTSIDEVEKESQEKKERVHNSLKNCLQIYAEGNSVKGIYLLKDLIQAT